MTNKSFENGSELWNMPWHARLKDLADVATATGQYCFKAVRAQSAPTLQSAANPDGSWLGRARSRATSELCCTR